MNKCEHTLGLPFRLNLVEYTYDTQKTNDVRVAYPNIICYLYTEYCISCNQVFRTESPQENAVP